MTRSYSIFLFLSRYFLCQGGGWHIFLFLCAPSVFSQGLLLDDANYELQSTFPAYDEGSKAELETLKDIYKIDLKPYCPFPQDQGFIASCTGWASGYGALTIMKAIEMGWANQRDVISENAFSALFIYNQIKKGSCDFGAYMSDAAVLIRDKGDALSKDYDKLKNKCDKSPTEPELAFAAQHRIKDFITIFNSSDQVNMKVLRTKLCLAQNKPVTIGISMLKNFQSIPPGDEYWYPQIGDTTAHGGHSMVVIGFDDGREAFEVMNSWGPNWANKGFVWIKYRDFGRYCHYGYIFIDERDASGFFDLTCTMSIRKPIYSDPETLQMKDVQVVFKDGYYELMDGLVRRGDVLQPVLIETKRDAYFYAFSIDPKGIVKVHWPRDGLLDNQFTGSNESAIVTIPKIGLSIPGRYSALQLNTAGTEYWCFLIAEKPIKDLNKYLTALKSSTLPDMRKRIEKVFGSTLISTDKVRYASDKIQIESDLAQDKIVHALVKIVVKS